MRYKLTIFNESGVIDEIISEQKIRAEKPYEDITIDVSPLISFRVNSNQSDTEIASLKLGDGCGYTIKEIEEK